VAAFAIHNNVTPIKFGMKQFAPVFAAQSSVLIISSGMMYSVNANVLQLNARITSIGMKNHADASANIVNAQKTFQTDTSLTKKSVSANALSQLKHVKKITVTILISASVFVPRRTAAQTNSGVKNIVNVSANQKSVLRLLTGGLTWKNQQNVVASANNTYAQQTTIGMRTLAIASAPQENAQKTSIGTVSSANADALLLIVQMRKFTQLTALRLVLAFVLKTHKTSAALANISTMLNANAYVPLKFAPLTIIGTPELVVASQNTAVAQLVNISTLNHYHVNALINHVQLAITGTIKHASASARLMQIVKKVIGLTHQHALAVASTQHQRRVSTST
jgi:hypothetical protein